MKTQFLRVSALALTISSSVWCAECKGEQVKKVDVPLLTPASTVESAVKTNLPTTTPPPMENPGSALESPDPEPTAPPEVKVVQPVVPPQDVQSSPALAEIVKLAQAGVSEEVMLAYINNAPHRFNVTSDQIVYLNDLGVPTSVITSLVQHDSLPTGAPNNAPPPPGVPAPALPPTNIYPATVFTPQSIPAPNTADPALIDPNADMQAPVVEAEPPPPDYFYGALSPYGSWVDVGGYGRCWQPTVAVVSPSWRPYCDRGHWVWTDAGWYWYSDYSWGWAPFHYGRWCSAPRVGWFWVPDTCWGPAWVSWRQTSAYCGWAPLPPGVLFVSGRGFVHHGVQVGVGFDFGLSARSYTFVPLAHFHDRGFVNYRLPASEVRTVYRNSVVVNRYTANNNGAVINHGVGVDIVAKASGQKIPTVAIQTASPASSGKLARHEQMQNGGSTLAVTRPPPSVLAKPAHVSLSLSAQSGQGLRSGPRIVSTPQRAPASRDPVAPTKPNVVYPTRGLASTQPNSIETKGFTAPSALPRQPRSSTLAVAPYPASPPAGSRAEKPSTYSGPIPRVAQPPPASQQTPSSRSFSGSSQAPARPEMYRVYPEPEVARKPANPHNDVPPAQFGRATTPSSVPLHSQFAPVPGMMAPPNHYSEPRSPAMRSEPIHSQGAVPSVSHNAPSIARGSGGKKD